MFTLFKRPSTISSLIAFYVGGILFQGVSRLLDRSLEDIAQSLARLLATVSMEVILVYDYGTIERYLKDLVQNPDIKYLKLVRDDNGEVLGEAGQIESDTAYFLHIIQPLNLADQRFATI